MPRMPRVEYAGAIYHVTVRMIGYAWETGQNLDRSVCLFRDDKQRERFLDQLAERVEAYGVRLYAYCLMLTHVHLGPNKYPKPIAISATTVARTIINAIATYSSILTPQNAH